MRMKSHTILFTEACPLSCRYCYLKDSDNYGNAPLNEEEIFAEIDRVDKEDNQEEEISMLLFTGGEPFLYPEMIKKVLTKYGNRFWYRFNTSGYLLTKEMIEFLSHYVCDFVLSVDGDEKLTNYLRPVNTAKYRTGYMKKLKEILPTLLWYFPRTPFRIIVAPRYVDVLHQMYLFAEECGFRHFTFILDFESRPSNPMKGKKWTAEDTVKLQEEINKIILEIAQGWKNGISRPMVKEIDEVLRWEANKKSFTPDLYPCRVFDGRSNYTVSAKNPNQCLAIIGNGDMNEVRKKILTEYAELKGACPNNPSCGAFEYCAQNCCPKNNYDAHRSFFKLEELDCALRRVCYYGAISLLQLGLTMCPNSSLFQQYLREMGFNGEKGSDMCGC